MTAAIDGPLVVDINEAVNLAWAAYDPVLVDASSGRRYPLREYCRKITMTDEAFDAVIKRGREQEITVGQPTVRLENPDGVAVKEYSVLIPYRAVDARWWISGFAIKHASTEPPPIGTENQLLTIDGWQDASIPRWPRPKARAADRAFVASFVAGFAAAVTVGSLARLFRR